MFNLIPKEAAFFDLFEKAADNAHACTMSLVEFFDRFDDLPERARRIEEMEHVGDELTHDTIERLNRTFITPLDREDIHELVCHAAIALGTLMGGWRIVKTMGQKICKLQPVHGFAAETAGALTLYGATGLGIPVSTTHTITGAIVGVGSTRGIRAVKWGVATRVVWAWILTIPAAACIGAGPWWLFTLCGWS